VADLAIAPTNVKFATGRQVVQAGQVTIVVNPGDPLPSVVVGTAHETVNAGETCYSDPNNLGRYRRGDADVSTDTARVVGVALSNAFADQVIFVLTEGDLLVGTGVVTPGETYVQSRNPGKVCPVSDLTAGAYLTHVGYGKDANTLHVEARPREVVRA
jgi:hypothetical protein